MQTALLTVTHDISGKNIELYTELKSELEGLYSEIFITISDESSLELIKVIEESNFKVKIIPKNGAAHARREVLKFGLEGNSKYFHYCDFDRILTWGKYYLNELKTVVLDVPNYDYQILGRSDRAIKTHPIEWIETEKITNKIFSLEFGRDVDITSGSCSFSKESAEYINGYSKEKMTDSEWAMIIARIAKLQVDYKTVEGLEYHEEINSVDKEISDSDKWLRRLELSLIISRASMYTGK
ncbi:hypothetical protein [Psychrobacillus vulpis]|uniref:Glycosyltransferase family 2 protein n=1 Tax=Psychrobacillus vulpis TaxID=2325572 RepID=A0A544TNY3_9BACI|nr:hypothetical protein [Psychrobacillus vulpis]TQR19161.1 hypothetical protein FG384_14240 [Psychrobacillus vulpis]